MNTLAVVFIASGAALIYWALKPSAPKPKTGPQGGSGFGPNTPGAGGGGGGGGGGSW